MNTVTSTKQIMKYPVERPGICLRLLTTSRKHYWTDLHVSK